MRFVIVVLTEESIRNSTAWSRKLSFLGYFMPQQQGLASIKSKKICTLSSTLEYSEGYHYY